MGGRGRADRWVFESRGVSNVLLAPQFCTPRPQAYTSLPSTLSAFLCAGMCVPGEWAVRLRALAEVQTARSCAGAWRSWIAAPVLSGRRAQVHWARSRTVGDLNSPAGPTVHNRSAQRSACLGFGAPRPIPPLQVHHISVSVRLLCCLGRTGGAVDAGGICRARRRLVRP